MRVPYELKQGQSRIFHKFPSGLKMEVIFQKGLKMKEAAEEKKEDNSQKPPLVFVHGSFHAAWCWAEHWLPFFSGHGFDSYALSLLGQGESDAPAASVAGTLQICSRGQRVIMNRFFRRFVCRISAKGIERFMRS